MDQILKDRAALFSKYISEEIRGAIAAKGHSQRSIAKELERQPKNLGMWLKGERQMPMDVAYQICDYIGMDMQTIVTRAEQDVIRDLGPYLQIEIDPSLLTHDQAADLALRDLDSDDVGLVAYRDEHKQEEIDGDGGEF